MHTPEHDQAATTPATSASYERPEAAASDASKRPYPHLTDDEKRTLLVLIMEDIRGSFDLHDDGRTRTVITLADDLGYEHIAQSARDYLADDGYRDGRWFRSAWEHGGYENPPFAVVRMKAEASEALAFAVEDECEYPEYRLEDVDPDEQAGRSSLAGETP